MQLEWDTPLYQQALTQLDHALELAGCPTSSPSGCAARSAQ